MNFNIRQAIKEDLQAITDIYNDAVLTTVATFDTLPKTIESQQVWFNQHGEQFPILVAENQGKIIGWSSLSQWSDRCAYSKTAETSTYVHKYFQRQGIGKSLLQHALEIGKEVGFRNILARIVSTQQASIELHTSLGFTLVGTMNQVGEKFDKLHDVSIFQYLNDVTI